MEQALAHSCNGYFIELIKKMPYNALLNMAKKFKLGESVPLAPGMNSDKGTLPSEESLKNIKTLANFSFGQGKLMATPLQVTGIINTIASGGIYSNPKLIKGLTDESMKIIKKDIVSPKRERIISEITAKKLKSHMKASIDYGTSERGKPEKTDAAAKTSTAQKSNNRGLQDFSLMKIQNIQLLFFRRRVREEAKAADQYLKKSQTELYPKFPSYLSIKINFFNIFGSFVFCF